MNQKNYFGPKLYVVHGSLEKIVEGHPLIKKHPGLNDHAQHRKGNTKFGNIYGSFLQFNLYDISKPKPEIKVCVYWSCDDCFKTKKEAAAVLTQILEKRIKGEQEDKVNCQGQIEDLHDQIRDINANIKDIQKQIKKLNES